MERSVAFCDYRRCTRTIEAMVRAAATLAAAHLYLHFRWLGNQTGWLGRPECRWRLQALQATAARLGLR